MTRLLFWALPDLQNLGSGDLDAEALQADIMPLARRKKANGGDAEVFQDLRAEADLQPLAFALLCLRVDLLSCLPFRAVCEIPTPTEPSRR